MKEKGKRRRSSHAMSERQINEKERKREIETCTEQMIEDEEENESSVGEIF